MDTYGCIERTLSELESLYHEMDSTIEKPVPVDMNGYECFRYRKLSDSLACFLKGINAISSLNAAFILLKSGHTQEMGALFRIVDECCIDIYFLLIPQDGDKFSKDQKQLLNDFFQEEFDKPMDPFGSTQKRKIVPIKKKLAMFAKMSSPHMNPSDSQEMLRTIYQTLSGYIHSAYPHIMEMYCGYSPHFHFHLSGMPGTPRIEVGRRNIITYAHRVIMASFFVAKKLGATDVEKKIKELLVSFQNDTGSKPQEDAGELLKKMKKKTTQP